MNRHHVLFTRTTWESQPNTSLLRRNRWLLVPMEEEAHHALHKEVTTVPVLPHTTAHWLTRNYIPYPYDFAKSADEFMRCVETANRHPRVSQLERQLGELVVYAIELQMPYIEQAQKDIASR